MSNDLVGLLGRTARRGARVTTAFGVAGLAGAAALAIGVHGLLGHGLALALAALAGLWLVTGVRVLGKPWRADAFAAFGGSRESRIAGAAAVEAELGETEARVFGRPADGVIVTRNWLLCTQGSLEVVRLADLLWVYPKHTSYSVNFVPVGTVHRIVVYTRSGLRSRMPLQLPVLAGRDREDSLLDVLAERAPLAFHGYRPEWEAHWVSVRDTVIAARAERG